MVESISSWLPSSAAAFSAPQFSSICDSECETYCQKFQKFKVKY
jgi:hypothetical protein